MEGGSMTLKDLREAVAKSQADIAKDCCVSVTTVSAWERGAAIPRQAHIRALAHALSASILEVRHVLQTQREGGAVNIPIRRVRQSTTAQRMTPRHN